MEIHQYQVLQNDIKKDILTGLFREGDLLPSENDLCSRYNVTRSTVRKALDGLVNEGYIMKKQGKGSIVYIKRNSLGLLSFKGFSDVLSEQKRKIRTIVLQDPILIRWPKNFFYPLTEEEKKAGSIFFNRLRFVDDNPVMLEYTYIPDTGLDAFLKEPLVNDSLFATLRTRYQVEVTNLFQDIRAIAADPDIAGMLDIYPTAPVLHIYRRFVTNRKDLMIYSSLYCNTDKFFISNEFE
jgi:DNA-binding GntR family transcriptional regulator